VARKIWYAFDHSVLTFFVFYLGGLQMGITNKAALLGAFVITLRDLDSLLDNTFGVDRTIKLPSETTNIEVVDPTKKE
jgi:hypothetical protein